MQICSSLLDQKTTGNGEPSLMFQIQRFNLVSINLTYNVSTWSHTWHLDTHMNFNCHLDTYLPSFIFNTDIASQKIQVGVQNLEWSKRGFRFGLWSILGYYVQASYWIKIWISQILKPLKFEVFHVQVFVFNIYVLSNSSRCTAAFYPVLSSLNNIPLLLLGTRQFFV